MQKKAVELFEELKEEIKETLLSSYLHWYCKIRDLEDKLIIEKLKEKKQNNKK